MKCLVTGGAGFIASHLVDRLLKDKHQVIVLDNFATGRKSNLSNLSNLTVKKADISQNWENLTEYFQNVDWVFHLAGLADIIPSIEKPLVYTQTNVNGTVNVLEASRKTGIKRFIYAASSSCYGIPVQYPTPETALINPQYPYALTKYVGEQFVLHWGKVYKIPVISLRLFNVFGPRSRTSGTYGAVFGTFFAQKLSDKPLTVVGNGSQSRDFIYVSDVVNAFIVSAKSNIANEIFNVGTGTPQTINTLVTLLGGNVVRIPKRPGEPDKTQADIRKIKRLLKWKPQVKFADGVKLMLKNIDYWKSAPVWTPKKIASATQDWFTYLG